MNRQIECPDISVPLRRHWQGIYPHVFIAPYPFFRLRREGAEGDDRYEPVKAPGERGSDFDDRVKRLGEAVSWHAVHVAVAPERDRETFFRAVWLLSALGYAERAGIALQEEISAWTEARNLYLPASDAPPAILEPALARFLGRFGLTHLTAYDEFRTESMEVSLEALADDAKAVALRRSGLYALHAPDPGVLISGSFDGAEAIIAMSNAARAIAGPERDFEVYPAGPETYVDWLNPKCFFPRQQ
ncbi:hypothetical protein [Oceanicola sp. S124]|uniref:hypothetical protein n=1 Tax=Oceanicola sp. S124 TaxID=1042378 RepID=UPI00025579BC|nr:hypothetical protein [Oceanicola sp. S124]